jgi:basic membrane protein A and related proteins
MLGSQGARWGATKVVGIFEGDNAMAERRSISRRQFVVGSAGAAALVTIMGPAGAMRASAQETPLKAAWVYVGPVSDDGWTAAHDEGRKAVEAAFPDKIETSYAESIPEAPADAERVIRDFAQKGNQLIFTTSFGYMQPTINVAKDFPNTVFVHISGFMTAENVGTGFAKIEEPRFVSGMIAGRMTKSNKLGYVAAFPIPEVIRGINAFTLGVRKVNPAATVKVVWTSTWFNPETERAAAEALLDGGVDVTAQHQDSPATLQAAEERGALGVGYDSPNMSAKAPKATLTSPIFNWTPFYSQTVQAVIDATWTTSQYWGGWKDGAVDLAPFGEMVPAEVKTEAEAEIAKFKSGEQSIYTIFTGPLKDQTGAEKVAAGTAMTDEELLGMTWFVEGVDGETAGG